MSAGPMPPSRFADFALEWVSAFNAHDLYRILSHHRADVELVSPLYQRFTGGLSDCVQGIEALEAYFHAALHRYPNLAFELIDIATAREVHACVIGRRSTDGSQWRRSSSTKPGRHSGSCAIMSVAEQGAISGRDRLLALSIIMIWASNFLALRLGLDRMAPLALCFWRFALSFIPACLVIPLPKANWRLMLSFGLITGVGQFGALALAIQGHVSAGLASALVQVQAVINVALAGLWLREPIRAAQAFGCLVSLAGLGLFLVKPDANATTFGIMLVLISAASWATCNVLLKGGGYRGDILSFLVWTSPVAAVPLLLLSCMFEGGTSLMTPLRSFDAGLWGILAWQAFANTLYGYCVWNMLIRRYSLARIGPLTLLVPVIAMSLTAVILESEPLPSNSRALPSFSLE